MATLVKRYDYDRHQAALAHAERMSHLYRLEATLDAAARGIGIEFVPRSAASAQAIAQGVEFAELQKEERRQVRKAIAADRGKEVSSESFDDSNDELRAKDRDASDTEESEVNIYELNADSPHASRTKEGDFEDELSDGGASRTDGGLTDGGAETDDNWMSTTARAAYDARKERAAQRAEAERIRIATIDPLTHTVESFLPPPPTLIAELSMESSLSTEESSDAEGRARAERAVARGDGSESESESAASRTDISTDDSSMAE